MSNIRRQRMPANLRNLLRFLRLPKSRQVFRPGLRMFRNIHRIFSRTDTGRGPKFTSFDVMAIQIRFRAQRDIFILHPAEIRRHLGKRRTSFTKPCSDSHQHKITSFIFTSGLVFYPELETDKTRLRG